MVIGMQNEKKNTVLCGHPSMSASLHKTILCLMVRYNIKPL